MARAVIVYFTPEEEAVLRLSGARSVACPECGHVVFWRECQGTGGWAWRTSLHNRLTGKENMDALHGPGSYGDTICPGAVRHLRRP